MLYVRNAFCMNFVEFQGHEQIKCKKGQNSTIANPIDFPGFVFPKQWLKFGYVHLRESLDFLKVFLNT